MQKIKTLLILLFIIAIAAFGSILYLNAPPLLMRDEFFVVQNDETLSSVAQRLRENNLIRDERFFRLTSSLLGITGVQKGKYRITETMTSIDILRRMGNGEILKHKITFPEGFNLFQIAERLQENNVCDSGQFLYVAFDREFIRSMNLDASSIEGYLFPCTYVFPEDDEPKHVISVMFEKTAEIIHDLSPLPADIQVHTLLTLASLVEKEAKLPEERPLISAVFHNRLEKKMRMECDPTVRYAVKKFTGRITYADLGSDSAYNTYRYKGLPPGPICSPGLDSIRAALAPAKSDYLFFVARNDGSHYFSRTIREHSRAVDYYQKGIRNGFSEKTEKTGTRRSGR